MANLIRKQLTLFLEQKDAETIENVRKRYNSKQFEIIKAHVTLCREDEIQNIELVISNLFSLRINFLNIMFKPVARFENGKGLFIPASTDNIEFQDLRSKILDTCLGKPRFHQPHITLMHPRNSTCTDNIFKEVEKIKFPGVLNFKKISLIQQETNGHWETLQEFNL